MEMAIPAIVAAIVGDHSGQSRGGHNYAALIRPLRGEKSVGFHRGYLPLERRHRTLDAVPEWLP